MGQGEKVWPALTWRGLATSGLLEPDLRRVCIRLHVGETVSTSREEGLEVGFLGFCSRHRHLATCPLAPYSLLILG